jgi:hypothetical protein
VAWLLRIQNNPFYIRQSSILDSLAAENQSQPTLPQAYLHHHLELNVNF